MRHSLRSTLGGGHKSLLLPRELAREGVSWPRCGQCVKSVDAYGIDNETPLKLEVFVRCDGVKNGVRVHAPQRAGFTIDKSKYGHGISFNELTDIMSRMTLQPGAAGKWVLDRRTSDVVRKT